MSNLLTTAINYTNGPPHMGHAYEAILGDVMARASLDSPQPSYFLTGSDEHGAKIQKNAQSAGLPVQAYCNQWVWAFQSLNSDLAVQPNYYIRTSSEIHKQVCHQFWLKCLQAGDIYKDVYSGWYNIREESFVSPSEAQQSNFKDPLTKDPLIRSEREAYFFRLSRYNQRLIDWLASPEVAIEPSRIRSEMTAMAPFHDFCISRLREDSSEDWDIPVPNDPEHVIYVWFDALINYISGSPNVNWDMSHIIGKDIARFHLIYWPAMLWSAGYEAPKRIICHGFINDKNGVKMSKSIGNVIDPVKLVKQFGSDCLRFYLLNNSWYSDISFDSDRMITMYNDVLIKTVGNLFNRVFNLAQRFWIQVPSDQKIQTIHISVEQFQEDARKLNAWLTHQAPWSKGIDHERRDQIIREALQEVAHLTRQMMVFMPVAGQKARNILDKLGKEPVEEFDLIFPRLFLPSIHPIQAKDVPTIEKLSENRFSPAICRKGYLTRSPGQPEIISFILISNLPSEGTMNIEFAWTHPDYRRQGYASQLVQHIKGLPKVEQIDAETSSIQFDRLLNKLGFELVSRRN